MAPVKERVGVLTFLFCDIEGSTRLLQTLGDTDYRKLIDGFRKIMRETTSAHSGSEIGTEGDGFFASFGRPSDALDAALKAQDAIDRRRWPSGTELKVRMGIHSGEVTEAAGTLVGIGIHVAARVMSAAHGAQILASGTVTALAPRKELRSLGTHRLKDVHDAVELFELSTNPATRFPPPRTLDSRRNNLPDQITSFVGRHREITAIKDVVRRKRCTTLIGPGGTGKTRLAVETGFSVVEDFSEGVWLIELSTVQDPALVPTVVGQSLGRHAEDGDLARALGDSSLLIIFDNCEHLVNAVAELVGRILSACPNVKILNTSRMPLGVTGEQIFHVPPMSLESEDGAEPEAVKLFLERALENDPGFTVDESQAQVLRELVDELDCLPLALELAASKLQTMGLNDLRIGLQERMRLLGDPSDGRKNLRSVLDWSYDSLEDSERILLRRLSLFAGPFTQESAAAVCGFSPLTPDIAEGIERLVLRSLVQKQSTPGTTTYRLLETVREYADEKLADANETKKTTLAYVDHFAEKVRIKELIRAGAEPSEWFSEEELALSRLRQRRSFFAGLIFLIGIVAILAAYFLEVPDIVGGTWPERTPLIRFLAPLIRFLAPVFVGATFGVFAILPIRLYVFRRLRPASEDKPFRVFKFVRPDLGGALESTAGFGVPGFLFWMSIRHVPYWWLILGLALPFLRNFIASIALRTQKRADVTDPAIRSEVTRLVRASGLELERIVQAKQRVPSSMKIPSASVFTMDKRVRISLNARALALKPSVRRALLAQELSRRMGTELTRRSPRTRLIVVLVLGLFGTQAISNWPALHRLGGIASVADPDIGPLISGVWPLCFMALLTLNSWLLRASRYRADLIAAALTREPEAFAESLRESLIETKTHLSPLKRFAFEATPATRVRIVTEWERAQRLPDA